ncbi:hypothetical protein [Aquirhabdus parva]|uniref:Pyocin immunity protein n=1 Tax=Aquirhabdus parva TaxID=2283318 RepID=A0A345P9S3_9GAMM|nr:hypothetical protein [Aquirhabdus parva]AXI04032.1 hypothetical protein HYN46_14985 [Aquirhabdus parva]
MILTIEKLATYLGRDASILLADLPFKNWVFERYLDVDLKKPLIDYVFTQDGMDFVSDGDDKVNTIFLYSDELRYFRAAVHDMPLTSSRQEVIAHLGTPSKRGGKISDPILGEYGAWDRFTCSGYTIHIEYRIDVDIIKKVSLMRADVVP